MTSPSTVKEVSKKEQKASFESSKSGLSTTKSEFSTELVRLKGDSKTEGIQNTMVDN
jgi:hypothetical protein